MNGHRRVVITGMGIISPVGLGKEKFLDALFRGKTGFRPITLFDTSPYTVSVAGEITDFDPLPLLGKKGLRDLDRSTRLLCSAAVLATEDAGLPVTEANSGSIGVSIGSTFGSLHSISRFDLEGLTEGPQFVNPSLFPNTVLNSPASRVSIRLGIKGFNATISTGFCAGLDAVQFAADFIRLGRAEAVLAGGVEELCEETFLCFHNSGYLSGMDGSDPFCCPFDARRDGVILAEGAAVLVLENREHALARGAPVVAEVLGYGNAFHPSARKGRWSSGRGLRNAIETALGESGLTATAVDCIFAGANSTRELDRMEAGVIKETFGAASADVSVRAVKSMTGETCSASGVLSMAAAAGSLSKKELPPTVNYEVADPECDLGDSLNPSKKTALRNAAVIASDPLGCSAAVLLGSHE